jgi:hypothetical protein
MYLLALILLDATGAVVEQDSTVALQENAWHNALQQGINELPCLPVEVPLQISWDEEGQPTF